MRHYRRPSSHLGPSPQDSSSSLVMAVPTYDPAAQKVHFKSLDASLRCVLDHCGVRVQDQAHLGACGITTLRRASALYGDDAASARREVGVMGWTTNGLTGPVQLEMLVRVADIIAACKEAVIHAGREARERADTISSEAPKPIKMAQHQELKIAYEAKHGKLEKREV